MRLKYNKEFNHDAELERLKQVIKNSGAIKYMSTLVSKELNKDDIYASLSSSNKIHIPQPTTNITTTASNRISDLEKEVSDLKDIIKQQSEFIDMFKNLV